MSLFYPENIGGGVGNSEGKSIRKKSPVTIDVNSASLLIGY
jgi:hypothetical protein